MSLHEARKDKRSSMNFFSMARSSAPMLSVRYVPPQMDGELNQPETSNMNPFGSKKVFCPNALPVKRSTAWNLPSVPIYEVCTPFRLTKTLHHLVTEKGRLTPSVMVCSSATFLDMR